MMLLPTALTQLPRRTRLAILFVVVILLGAGVMATLNPHGMGFGTGVTLIGFDSDRALTDEATLTSIGPRMSGTDAEGQGAAYIASEFEKAGLQHVQTSEFPVRMYEVNTAEVTLVKYGPLGRFPQIVGSGRMIHYDHMKDFVVQGYSGSLHWGSNGDDLEMVDIGNGSDENAWNSAKGKAGIIVQEVGVASNTILFFKARDFGLAALVSHNARYGEENGYAPISKTTGLPDGETKYPDLPFFMVSKSVGEEMKVKMTQGYKIRLNIDVTREDRAVRVVTGDVLGTRDPSRFVMFGAHHDTVYNGPGAIDDTSGTTTVIELARQLARQKPAYSIRIATFGGEEEGIYGSYAWHDAHKDEIAAGLIQYFNFDMNNVDRSRCNTLEIVANTNSTVAGVREVLHQAQTKYRYFASYNISVSYVADIPNNSDHASFEDGGKPVAFAFGCGSYEYHSYKDDISHFDPESIGVSAIILGSYALAIANGA